jgi:hypothetical protein
MHAFLAYVSTNYKVQACILHASNANRESLDSDEDAEMCGASCFCHHVRRTRMPKGFKMPVDTTKYDGSSSRKLGWRTT